MVRGVGKIPHNWLKATIRGEREGRKDSLRGVEGWPTNAVAKLFPPARRWHVNDVIIITLFGKFLRIFDRTVTLAR